MGAEVILFPASRRVGFVKRQAAAVARYSIAGQERTIASALERQAAAFERLGADAADIESHIAELRIAIEALLPNGRRCAT